MSFKIVEIELSEPLSDVAIAEPETGVALIVRLGGRPLGFLMHDMLPSEVLRSTDVRNLIWKELDGRLLQQAGLEPGSRPRERSEEDIGVMRARFGRDLPALSIGICTKDRPEDLSRCLRQLTEVRASEPEGSAVEILVIYNAPSDESTRRLVESLEHIRYSREPIPGLNIARNRAIQDASGELLAFVDDDVLVDRRWLLGLKRALIETPEAAAVTGLVFPSELRTPAQILFERRGGFQKHYSRMCYGRSRPEHPFYPCLGGQFGTGCNMAFRRSVLLDLGGFDEALDTGATLPGGGDTDMFYRVVRSGRVLVYEPQFQVFHQHRTEMSQLRRQYCRSWAIGLMAYVSKTYRRDPEQRRNLRRLVRWWFRNGLREVAMGVVGRHPVPLGMLIAELSAGVIGLCGAYERSQRRLKKLRSQYGAPVLSG